MTTTPPVRRRVRWKVPALLVLAGVVFLVVGTYLTDDALARYDAALSHACTGNGTCRDLGPAIAQPEYVDGLGLIGTGIALVVVAFAVYTWVQTRRDKGA